MHMPANLPAKQVVRQKYRPGPYSLVDSLDPKVTRILVITERSHQVTPLI